MSTGAAGVVGHHYAETRIQKTALIAGIVFLVVGVAGFIPGITANVDEMTFAGEESNALLLGVFQVSVLHNIVHLLFGVAGAAFARTPRSARSYLIWGGVVYALIWVYGLIFSGGVPANIVPLNSADNWLHLVLAVGMIALGLILGRGIDNARTSQTSTTTGRV